MSRNIWENSGNKEKALDANVENTQHTVPFFDNRCVDICGQRNVVKYMASKIHMDENSLYPGSTSRRLVFAPEGMSYEKLY